ncbi:MAG: response regulator [Calditrichia bacterium]
MTASPNILFVDDEASVLKGLRRILNLRRSGWKTVFIESPTEAIELLKSGDFNIIVSDMRMPELNGAELLSWARNNKPDTQRVLLTGQADMKDAIQAINEGQIFRFLTKPCPPELLIETIEEAFDYYCFLTDRQELVAKTLDSSVQLMLNLMKMFDPQLAEAAIERKVEAANICKFFNIPNAPMIKIAALLSRIGEIAISNDIRQKMKRRDNLNESEKRMWNSVPKLGYQLLKDVPRLEQIARIVLYQDSRFDKADIPNTLKDELGVPSETHLLKILLDKGILESQGIDIPQIIEIMNSREGLYDPVLLEKSQLYFLRVYTYLISKDDNYFSLNIRQLREGHKLFSPVITKDGIILFPAGTILKDANIAAIENWDKLRGVNEPIKIVDLPLVEA